MHKIPFVDIHSHSLIIEETANKPVCNLIIDEDFIEQIDRISLLEGKAYSAGIHPWYILEDKIEDQLFFLNKLANNPSIIAIGEAGLDKLKGPSFKVQEQVFIEQIKMANRVSKPLIIHCVKSYGELIGMARLIQPQVPMIIHGFNKNADLAFDLIKKGFFLSFGADLISKPQLGYSLRACPLENVFFETDDSEVKIEDVYLAASKILNISMKKLAESIYDNFLLNFKK
jgi:TatD DNase family protein